MRGRSLRIGGGEFHSTGCFRPGPGWFGGIPDDSKCFQKGLLWRDSQKASSWIQEWDFLVDRFPPEIPDPGEKHSMTSPSKQDPPAETLTRPAATPNTPPADHELEQWSDLVWYVVNRVRTRLPASVSEEELYSAGMVGLMTASRSYDPSRGAEFKTYAYHRIRGAILDELRRMDFLPRSQREKARREGVEAPSFVGIPTDEDGQESLAADPMEAALENRELMGRLQAEILQLPEKMRVVMNLYYSEGMKMREIGERLHLTESRVSQIHSNAIARLRRVLRPASGA